MNSSDLCAQLAHALNTQVELSLVTRIEEIEGRVPSNAEIMQFGLRVVGPDAGSTWLWKTTPIVRVEPKKWPMLGFDVVELR